MVYFASTLPFHLSPKYKCVLNSEYIGLSRVVFCTLIFNGHTSRDSRHVAVYTIKSDLKFPFSFLLPNQGLIRTSPLLNKG